MCWKSLTPIFLSRVQYVVYAIILTLTMGIQIFTAYIYYVNSNFDLATTQLKISSMLTSIAVIGIAMIVPRTFRLKLSTCRLLTLTGDCSYGVYLCHLAFLDAILAALQYLKLKQYMSYFSGCIIIWLIVLCISILFTIVCQSLLPDKIQYYIGLE